MYKRYTTLKIGQSNLRVLGMKVPLRHVKGIASGTHGASEKFRFPFHTSKCCQGTVDNMCLQDMVQLSGCPACSRLSSCVSFVWKSHMNTSIYQYIPVYTNIYLDILLCMNTSIYQYTLVYTSISLDILLFILLFRI